MITGLTGELAALSGAFLWALASIIYSRLGQRIPPLELNLLKGVLAIAMLALTLLLSGESASHLDPKALQLLLLSGALGIGLGDTAYFESLNCLGARRALLLGVLTPPLTAFIALAFLGEGLTAGAWLGVGLTVCGVAWVVTERVPVTSQRAANLWRGAGFGLLAALAGASGAVLSRAALTQTDVSPLWSSLLRLLAGAVSLLVWIPLKRQPVAGWLKGSTSPRLWGVILFATFVGTYLGIWLQQTALKHTDAGIAQTLFATSPLFALPVSIWLGERVSLRSTLGAGVALAGVGLLFGS